MKEPYKSKTKKKQEAKTVEKLAQELLQLPPSLFNEVPCENHILTEIRKTREIKQFGARRRQIKYLSKLLRETEIELLLDFMEKIKKSRLKQNKLFQKLEHLRDRILHEDEEEQALEEAKNDFPHLNREMIQNLARKYRWTRNQRYSREIFRQLKIAQNLTVQSNSPYFTENFFNTEEENVEED